MSAYLGSDKMARLRRQGPGHRYVLIVADCGHHVWEKIWLNHVFVGTSCCPCIDPATRAHDTEVEWLEWSLPG